MKQAKQKESLEKYLMKSLLTIIADTADVEVWHIDRPSLIASLVDTPKPMPDNQQKILFESIITAVDEDRQSFRDPDILYIKEQFAKWERFKQEQVETLFETAAYAEYMKKGKKV